jgi:hypothetical protein
LTVALLVGSLLVVVLACVAIPTHVSLGAGTLRCGTVVAPDTESEVGPLCEDAAAHHLRGALGVGAVLLVLAAVPWLLDRRVHTAAIWAYMGAWVLVAGLSLLWLAWAYEYAPRHEIFDL